jgi:hypothetical protein
LENQEEEKNMDKRPFMEARRREGGDQQKELRNTLRKSEDTAHEEICRDEVRGEEEYTDRQKDMDGWYCRGRCKEPTYENAVWAN